jgi:hypothetical protein
MGYTVPGTLTPNVAMQQQLCDCLPREDKYSKVKTNQIDFEPIQKSFGFAANK